MQGKLAGLALEHAIIGLAERQHGVVARAQLLDLGLGAGAIQHRIGHERLHPVHRGVYALRYPRLSAWGRYTAAVLAAGPAALLSHRSAADLWVIRLSANRVIEVLASMRRRVGSGVLVRVAALTDDERTILHGIPVTTPSRTLLDLSAVLTPQQLERALREAEHRRLWDETSLAVLLERHPRRRGTGALRQIIAAGRAGHGITRSQLEERFLVFLDDRGLPRPKLNVHVQAAGRLVESDCVWRDERLIVELDGYETHRRRGAFESDRARDRALSAAGWRTVRVTWRQLERETASLAGDLQTMLSAAS